MFRKVSRSSSVNKKLGAVVVLVVSVALLGASGAQARQAMPECQIEAQPGQILVQFSDKLIRASKQLTDATDGPVAVSIPAGTYDVTLMSFDIHSSKEAVPGQPEERYFLELSNGQTTGAISDLPEDQDTLVEKVETGFNVTADLTTVTARHLKYPDPGVPNSLIPVCAAFDPVETPASPTPTPAAVGQGPGDETDCCPGPDEVVPTPAPKVLGVSKAKPSPTPQVEGQLQQFPTSGLPLASAVTAVAVLALVTALAVGWRRWNKNEG